LLHEFLQQRCRFGELEDILSEQFTDFGSAVSREYVIDDARERMD
jgi:hypothetical protein